MSSGNIYTTKEEGGLTMEIKLNVTGAKRKELVAAMGEILEVKPKYLGMPTAAYEVDYFTVDKVGTISFDDKVNCANGTREDALGYRADGEEIETLLNCLAQKGFVAEENQGANDATEEEKVPVKRVQADCGEAVGLIIEMPRDSFDETSLTNIENLISSKATLIKKALGIEGLPIEFGEERISFPWFTHIPSDNESTKAYTTFVYLLTEMAKKQKRINAKEKPTDNEKYAFRCFLLRLGFIGENYKNERKILLQNFRGSSAFRGKKYRVELADDEFKTFTAPNEIKAQELAWQIAEEHGSSFCELHEEVE